MGKLWTYTYTNNAKAQIDYILINKKWINSALNCEAYSSFEGVIPITELSQQRYVWAYTGIQDKQPKPTHYDWSSLNNRDISNKYTITLRNKFDALQEISKTLTPNKEYENFVNDHVVAEAECIPTKLRVEHKSPTGDTSS